MAYSTKKRTDALALYLKGWSYDKIKDTIKVREKNTIMKWAKKYKWPSIKKEKQAKTVTKLTDRLADEDAKHYEELCIVEDAYFEALENREIKFSNADFIKIVETKRLILGQSTQNTSVNVPTLGLINAAKAALVESKKKVKRVKK